MRVRTFAASGRHHRVGAHEEMQRSQRAEALRNRLRSALTPMVMTCGQSELNEYAAAEAVGSSQLPDTSFTGSNRQALIVPGGGSTSVPDGSVRWATDAVDLDHDPLCKFGR